MANYPWTARQVLPAFGDRKVVSNWTMPLDECVHPVSAQTCASLDAGSLPVSRLTELGTAALRRPGSIPALLPYGRDVSECERPAETVHECDDSSGIDTTGYGEFVRELSDLASASDRDDHWRAAVSGALDGLAGERLRQLVPISIRHSEGLYFTDTRVADELINAVGASLSPDSSVLDPACGAGDLLLAANRFRLARNWHGLSLSGLDLRSEFVTAAELRLRLGTPEKFARSRCGVGCGLCSVRLLRRSTHVLLNPPFASREAPPSVTWSSGRTNGAALFFARLAEQATSGLRIAAILPDVLLSGSRYARWRKHVESLGAIETIKRTGRFDRWTDVDTFILVLEAGKTGGSLAVDSSTHAVTVDDVFDVGVGAVVHNRASHEGREVAFLRSEGLPVSAVIHRISGRRQFTGRLEWPPFVAVRRTSGPREATRARATVILGKRPVAVDNHLLVLRPRDGSESTCRSALAVLGSDQSTKWLNERIACRHLTVGSVGSMPWQVNDA